MEALAIFGLCAVGTLFPLVNPELTTAAFAAKTGWSPFVVGALAAGGQCLTYALLQLLGGLLIPRWGWLARQVEKVRVRYGAHLERNYLLIAIPSGLVGLPPAAPIAALARGFEVPVFHLIPVLFATRTLRMALVAAFGRGVFEWWSG